MKANDLIASASVSINAPMNKVWDAFVNPDTIKKYMFGTTVISDWKEGGKILWKGEWKGRSYEDKGVILKLKPESKLEYSHFSPLSGLPDTPENYHKVSIDFSNQGTQSVVKLDQDNNATEEEKAQSETNWKKMLTDLKKLLEQNS